MRVPSEYTQDDAEASDKKHRAQEVPGADNCSNHAYTVAENYLSRNFYAARQAEKWVSDLTYIRTGEGWLYLTVVLDLVDRKVVGWALSSDDGGESDHCGGLADGGEKQAPVPLPFVSLQRGRAVRLQRVQRSAAGAAADEPQGQLLG